MRALPVSLLFVALAGCGRPVAADLDSGTPPEVEETPACPEGDTEAEALYREVWAHLRETYPYFEFKEIDWEVLGEQCRSVLVCDGEPTYRRFVEEGMECLLAPLADGHTGIVDRDGTSHSYGWSPRAPNLDAELLESAYLDYGSGTETAYTRTATLYGGSYGYIRVETWVTDGLDDVDVAGLLDEVGPVRGVVVDMRDNPGGSPYTAQLLAGRFVDDTETPYAYLREREERDGDPSTYELAVRTAETMDPDDVLPEVFVGPVAVLIGGACSSACETFTSMLHTLAPDVRTFGETTAGCDSRYRLDTLGDGETVLAHSVIAVLAADGRTPIEWTGMAPDEPVEFAGGGSDAVLEAAIAWMAAR